MSEMSFPLATAALLVAMLAGCDRQAQTPAPPPAKSQQRAPAPTAVRQTAPVRASASARVMQIAGDITLSDDELRLVGQIEDEARRQQPGVTKHEDREMARLLDTYDKAGRVMRGDLRHRVRAALHFGRDKMDHPQLLDVLDRHDPVLVEDAERKEVVSMADIRAMQASNRFVADMAGVSLPPLVEEPGERAQLQRRYRDDASIRTALTQASVRSAMLHEQWPRLPVARRDAVLKIIRDQVTTPETAADAARGIENALVLAEQRRVRAQRNSRALADFRRTVMGWHQVNMTIVRGEGILNALNANGF